jgi:hypothetical protein
VTIFFIICIISLPCVKLTRQRNVHSFFEVDAFSLPCAKYRTAKCICRACDEKRKTKILYRAKRCRVAFAVRFREKRTAKGLPCVSCSLPCTRNARQRLSFP